MHEPHDATDAVYIGRRHTHGSVLSSTFSWLSVGIVRYQ